MYLGVHSSLVQYFPRVVIILMVVDQYYFNDGRSCSVSFAGFSSSLWPWLCWMRLTAHFSDIFSRPVSWFEIPSQHWHPWMYVSSPDLWPELRDQISICLFHISTRYLTADAKGTCPKSNSRPHPTCPIAVLAIWVNVSFILPLARAQNLSTIPDSSLSLTPHLHPIHHQSFWCHLQSSYRRDTLLTLSVISHLDYYSLLASLLASIFFLNNLFSKPAAKVKTEPDRIPSPPEPLRWLPSC